MGSAQSGDVLHGSDSSLASATEEEKVLKTVKEWKAELKPMRFAVMCGRKFEAPSTTMLGMMQPSAGHDGLFSCGACQAYLFDYADMVDSRLGWPTFSQSISGAVRKEVNGDGFTSGFLYFCTTCNCFLGKSYYDGSQASSMIISGHAIDYIALTSTNKQQKLAAKGIQTSKSPPLSPRASGRLASPRASGRLASPRTSGRNAMSPRKNKPGTAHSLA